MLFADALVHNGSIIGQFLRPQGLTFRLDIRTNLLQE